MRNTSNWKGPLTGVLATLAVASLLIPGQAFAKTKILVLQTQGETLAAAEKGAATTVVRDSLSKYPKTELLPTPEVDLFELMLELECTDLDTDCLAAMGKKFGAQKVVYSTAEPDGDKLAIKFKVVDVKKKKAINELDAKAAGTAGLPDALGKLIVDAFGKLPEEKPPEPPKAKPVLVSVGSNIEGANVTINGEMAGRTPFKIRLKPGRYKIKLVREGYVEVEDVVTIGTKAQTVSFELKKKPATIAKPDKPDKPDDGDKVGTPFYKTWWFWTAIGVGVAGVVTTAVVLSIDDEPAQTGVMHFSISNPEHDPLVVREAWK